MNALLAIAVLMAGSIYLCWILIDSYCWNRIEDRDRELAESFKKQQVKK